MPFLSETLAGRRQRPEPVRLDQTMVAVEQDSEASPPVTGRMSATGVTSFLSDHAQSIVPAPKNLRRTRRRAEHARVASVVSLPPEVAALPSSHL